ncbi:fungal-specific transcription factor domain-containing protein [Thozetella sp. PMI_491]|nr:fungal-specific transcription factor domain-containing protein [Thozetella sp. PMI_491]
MPRPPVTGMPSLHDRLVQLERLVKSLAPGPASTATSGLIHDPEAPSGGGGQVESANPGTPMDSRSECGSMRMSTSEPSYVGGEHWAAILDNIADLKEQVDQQEQLRMADSYIQFQGDDGEDDQEPSATNHSPHVLLLYGCPRPTSRAEVLAALPPKEQVDRYISRYFNRVDLVSCGIHGPSFLQEYESFWVNPSGFPITWLGFLFSFICLALLVSDDSDAAHGSEGDQRRLQIDLYREKIVQCLVIGDYTNGGPYVLETMSHYVYVEFLIHPDAHKDVWFLMGLVIHLAMRMGYHRDPGHFTGITPFQGEMRRRLWASLLQGEVLLSGQMGMPRIVTYAQCDAAEPRNLDDSDLDVHATELPPSRPETQQTTVLGLIARRRMILALGTISDLRAMVQPCDYAEVMRVDSILHEAAASLPLPLRMKPMAASITDTPQTIMTRLFISHMFYRGQIVLHQRFLYAKSTPTDVDSYAYSRKSCLEAALGMLQIQHALDEETRPGGQLHVLRWRKTSNMNHQFLTATMILCSMLHGGQTLGREDEITSALRRARTIWLQGSASSDEAKKAADAVSVVLARAGRGEEDIGIQIVPELTEHHSGGYQDLYRDAMNLYESDGFIMPSLFALSMPSDQQEKEHPF